jgi:FtsH-binding integral membrane protein
MLEMDENDGLRAILLTCFITVAAAIVGMYSGIDFSFMRSFLFFGLCALILIGLVRLFFGMTTAMIRAKAIAGAILFSLYLVYDFNRLKQIGDLGVNDWSTALQIAISIYLDILNLLLEILDAMGNS